MGIVYQGLGGGGLSPPDAPIIIVARGAKPPCMYTRGAFTSCPKFFL